MGKTERGETQLQGEVVKKNLSMSPYLWQEECKVTQAAFVSVCKLKSQVHADFRYLPNIILNNNALSDNETQTRQTDLSCYFTRYAGKPPGQKGSRIEGRQGQHTTQ